ncbi:uncharacterized protein LOC120346701 [Styela clava]|uniref:transcription factor VBP-like n=1 Tax=Styela clava TaxID=7725 RepID=UPI001939EDD9|nr:transcription factor VBP-like [Styela clava]
MSFIESNSGCKLNGSQQPMSPCIENTWAQMPSFNGKPLSEASEMSTATCTDSLTCAGERTCSRLEKSICQMDNSLQKAGRMNNSLFMDQTWNNNLQDCDKKELISLEQLLDKRDCVDSTFSQVSNSATATIFEATYSEASEFQDQSSRFDKSKYSKNYRLPDVVSAAHTAEMQHPISEIFLRTSQTSGDAPITARAHTKTSVENFTPDTFVHKHEFTPIKEYPETIESSGQFAYAGIQIHPIIRKARKVYVPEECKDGKYWKRRLKNNVAARRSREAKRMKENQIAMRVSFLQSENDNLRAQVAHLRKEMRRMAGTMEPKRQLI